MAALSWKDKRLPLAVRFWAKVKRGKPDECWNWTGCKSPMGYGCFNVNNRMRIASRIAWELTNGEIRNGLCVLHDCDNPPCCNPKHLFLGTRTDNANDKVRKGRARGPAGVKSASAKLTDAQVIEIRETFIPFKTNRAEFAKKFGISIVTLSGVLNGRGWKHIPTKRKHPKTPSKGTFNGMAVLTEIEVLQIRKLHSAGFLSMPEIGRRFGVSRSCVQAIVERTNWKHI